jgi:2-oxoglutarate/2-oxoacid ferredoxin oxidoreductase subunit beta
MSDCKFCTTETAWCGGCGNENILESLRLALEASGKKPQEVLIVGGIGQAAKTPQYINTNGFCGLHGRALPPAIAAKIANKNLTVIVDTGDGDSYGEGGNHFMHNIRRNVDITHFVHDNQVYGLTKGQASPTTEEGYITDVQTLGAINIQFNPLLVALALGAGFVARAFTGRKDEMTQIMTAAINFKGYALVDILQPCVTFNKTNTFQWYNKRVYGLEDGYNSSDLTVAMQKAMEWGDKIPVGILFKKEKTTYHEKIDFLAEDIALIDREYDLKKTESYMSKFE